MPVTEVHQDSVVVMVIVVDHLCARLVGNGHFMVQSAGALEVAIQPRATPYLQEFLNSEIGSTER